MSLGLLTTTVIIRREPGEASSRTETMGRCWVCALQRASVPHTKDACLVNLECDRPGRRQSPTEPTTFSQTSLVIHSMSITSSRTRGQSKFLFVHDLAATDERSIRVGTCCARAVGVETL